MWLFISSAQATEAASPVSDPYSDLEYVQQLSESGAIMSMQLLLQHAAPHIHGRIIETALEHEHGRLLYEVEYLDESGVTHEVYFDARRGTLISAQALAQLIKADERDKKTAQESKHAPTAR
jgi:uncharacterized membrane protein YkoI